MDRGFRPCAESADYETRSARTAAAGASRSLRGVPAIVSFLNPQLALSLADANRPSCPTADLRGKPKQATALGVLRPSRCPEIRWLGPSRRRSNLDETPRDWCSARR
jgi:hypothetical protein